MIADGVDLRSQASFPEMGRRVGPMLLVPIGDRAEIGGVQVRHQVEPFPSGLRIQPFNVTVQHQRHPEAYVSSIALLVAPIQRFRPGQLVAIIALVINKIAGNPFAQIAAHFAGIRLQCDLHKHLARSLVNRI